MLVPYESLERPLEVPDVKTFRKPLGDVPGKSRAGWVVFAYLNFVLTPDVCNKHKLNELMEIFYKTTKLKGYFKELK